MFSDIYTHLLRNMVAQDNHFSVKSNESVVLLHEPESQLRTTAFGYLIEQVYKTDPDSDLGLRFGKQILPANVCEFSRMVTTAPTVYDLISVLTSHYHSLGLKPYPIFFLDNKFAYIALTYPYSQTSRQEENQHRKKLNRFCSESFFSYIVNTIRDLVDNGFVPSYMALDYSDPGYGKKYQYYFGSPVEFDSGLSLIKFHRGLLKQPLKTSHPQLHEVYKERLMEEWQLDKRRQSYRYRAVTKMMSKAPQCFQIGNLSSELNISVRGLQKRLQGEGCSFSDLVLQVRRELLKTCLVRQDISLEESSNLLGFQTLSSFKRFFKESLDTLK